MTSEYTQEFHKVLNVYDEVGATFGIDRLPEESNSDYRARILDVKKHQQNASYEGLVNGLNRTLGLEVEDAITVSVKPAYVIDEAAKATISLSGKEITAPASTWTDDQFIGYSYILGGVRFSIISNTDSVILLASEPDPEVFAREDSMIQVSLPRIDVTSTELLLFSFYVSQSNYALQLRINLRNKNNLFITDIVNAINLTKDFQAEMNTDLQFVLAKTLKRCSSEIFHMNISIPAAKAFDLGYENIKIGSVLFSEDTVFVKEVSTPEAVEIDVGNYFINYETGRVLVNGQPKGTGIADLFRKEFPLTIESTPVIINTLSDAAFNKTLYTQKPANLYETFNEQFFSARPTSTSMRIIDELLDTKNRAWGK